MSCLFVHNLVLVNITCSHSKIHECIRRQVTSSLIAIQVIPNTKLRSVHCCFAIKLFSLNVGNAHILLSMYQMFHKVIKLWLIWYSVWNAAPALKTDILVHASCLNLDYYERRQEVDVLIHHLPQFVFYSLSVLWRFICKHRVWELVLTLKLTGDMKNIISL